MTTPRPRTLRFAVGGALLAVGAFGMPIDEGCGLVAPRVALDESAAQSSAHPEPDPGPIIVNPGPINPPLPITTEPRIPLVVNPGPVEVPKPARAR
jgi:hypothetical protein